MATETLARSDHTGLSDSTHSSASSRSAVLDEWDNSPILVYKYRGELQTTSQKELSERLRKDERLRVTKKPIPKWTSLVDVKRHDLYLPDEKDVYARFPNYDSSLAAIEVPASKYWSRIIFGNYCDLYIVSPESSPSSSEADSASRRSTWSKEDVHEADDLDIPHA